MKRKKRDFSPRERRLIDGFIWDICRALRLPRDRTPWSEKTGSFNSGCTV